MSPRKHALDGMHIGNNWRIQLNHPRAAEMRSFVKLLWPLAAEWNMGAHWYGGNVLQYYFIIFRSSLGDDLINWNSGLSSVTSTRSKVKIKVTELPKFRKLHFSRSISSATVALSSKLMVDHDNMGPSLQLIGARFLNFLLIKLSLTSNFMECLLQAFKWLYFLIAWG